jgi:hypothetical protein
MKARLLYLKMAIWRGGWRGMRAFLVTAFVGANAVDWASLSSFEKFVIIVGGVVAAGDAIDAFVDQTMTKLKDGNSLVPLETK